MWRVLGIIGIIAGTLVAGCAPEPPLPTEVPTSTPVPPTETPMPTRTPIPTATPTVTPPPSTAEDPSQQSFIRFVHTAEALGTVDFYVDDARIVGFMEPGSFTDPNGLVAGQYRLSARPNSRIPSATILAETTLTLPGQESVLVVLSGTADAPVLTVLREDLSPLSGNRARVSLFNALSTPISLSNGTTALATDVAPAARSETSTIEASTLELNLRQAGQIIFTSRYTLRPRQHVVFIPYQPQGSAQPRLLTVTSPILGITQVGLINTIDGLAIDVIANGELVAPALGNRQIVEPVATIARETRLELFASGADRTRIEPVLRTSINLPADQQLYLIFMGTPESPRVVTYTVDPTPTEPNTGRLVLVNTLPQFSRTVVRSNMNVEANVPYGVVVRQDNVPAGPLPLVWAQAQMGDNMGAEIEMALNFTLEAGAEVLYLLTGDPLSPPLTVTTRVGQLQPVVEVPTPTPDASPILYAINVLEGLSIEFRVNDVPLSAPLGRRTASVPRLAPTAELVLTALRPDTSQLLGREVITLQPNTLNVVTLRQLSDLTYDLVVIETPRVDTAEPTVRLLNLSEDTIPLGLAIAPNNGSTFAFPDPNAQPDPNTGLVNFRISYPIGLTRLARGVDSRNTSPVVPVRSGQNRYDLYVVDDFDGSVSNIIPNIPLEAGRHHDVVAYKLPQSQEVIAFVLPLPRP